MEKPLVKRAPGPVFYQYGLTLILAWVINDMPSYLWDGITHLLPNFDSWTIDFWELLSNSISNFALGVITYPCSDQKQTLLVKKSASGIIWHKYEKV